MSPCSDQGASDAEVVLALNGSDGPATLDARSLRGIVGLLSLGAFASSAAMRVCDAMLPRLVEEFDSSVSACAAVNTGFAIAYGLLQVVIGPLGDRLGKYRVITTAMMCAALASIACALAPNLQGLVAARVIAGGMGGAIIRWPLPGSAITFPTNPVNRC